MLLTVEEWDEGEVGALSQRRGVCSFCVTDYLADHRLRHHAFPHSKGDGAFLHLMRFVNIFLRQRSLLAAIVGCTFTWDRHMQRMTVGLGRAAAPGPDETPWDSVQRTESLLVARCMSTQ